MPVRFLCDNCRGLLSVGRKKIGAQIECPKCGAAMVVPEMEAAAAGLAMAYSRQGQEPSPSGEQDLLSEFVVFDDPVPEAQPVPPDQPPADAAGNGDGTQYAAAVGWADTQQRGEAAAQPAGPSLGEQDADAYRRQPQPSRPRRSDRQRQAATPAVARIAAGRTPAFVRSPGSPMLLVSRRVVYVQAVLFGIIALAAFVSGWLIGRGMPPAEAPDPEVAAASETVLLQGTISYVSRDGGARTDGGAVLIALPAGKRPETRLPSSSLGPLGPAPAETSPVLLAIEELGGGYGRANADGHYSLVVPRPGRYQLLIISRHTRRLGGTPVAEADVETLRPYFTSAPVLIGQQKYALLTENVPAGLYDKSHDFGISGQRREEMGERP